MMHCAAFLALLVLAVTGSRLDVNPAEERLLWGYKGQLTQGLPDEVSGRVLGELNKLKPVQIKSLYSVFCKDSECATGAMAFLVDHGHELCRENKEENEQENGDDEKGFEVDVCALWLPDRFMVHITTLKDGEVPIEQSHLASTPDIAVFVKAIDLWYADAKYKVEEGDKTFRAILPYLFLADEDEEDDTNRKLGAKILLGLTAKPHSKTLFEYWMAQPADKRLEVYRNALHGEFCQDLPVLQPVIFGDMECLKDRSCTEASYADALTTYAAPMKFPRSKLAFLPRYLLDEHFAEAAEMLRKLTGEGLMETVGEVMDVDKWMLLLRIPGLELPAELRDKVAAAGFDSPKNRPDYLILDPAKAETLTALSRQLARLGLEGVKCVGERTYYPHERMAEYITDSYNTLEEYVKLYEAAVRGIEERVFKTDWVVCRLLRPAVMDNFGVDTYWQLLEFLKKNSQYAGIFRALIDQSTKEPGATLGGLAPEGVGAFVTSVIEASENERHAMLTDAAEYLIREAVPDHLFFKDQFKSVREACRGGLSKVFDVPDVLDRAFDRYVLGIEATKNESGDLYDLQVSLVANNVSNFFIRNSGSVGDLEKLKTILGEYSTKQLWNIYKSAVPVYAVFSQVQLRNAFKFDQPITRTQVFHLLSRVYQEAFPDHKSVFGLILKHLKDESDIPGLAKVSDTIMHALLLLPDDRDFSGNSDNCWRDLEASAYDKTPRWARTDLVGHLGSELGFKHMVGGMLDTRSYETFEGLMEFMSEEGEREFQGHKGKLLEGLPSEVKERVSMELDNLKLEQVENLVEKFCRGDQCEGGAVAFVVDNWRKFGGAEGEEMDVSKCISSIKPWFEAQVAEECDLESLTGRKIIEGLGMWYEDVGYTLEGNETLKGALPYVLLSSGGAEATALGVRLILGLTSVPHSETLATSWGSVRPDELLSVYRNALQDKHGDLVILQPNFFASMKCIEDRNCSEEDYSGRFRSTISVMIDFGLSLRFSPEDLSKLPFSKVAEFLRDPAKGMQPALDLGFDDQEDHPDHLILSLADREGTPRALNGLMAQLEPPQI